jgi:hypothetical protein
MSSEAQFIGTIPILVIIGLVYSIAGLLHLCAVADGKLLKHRLDSIESTEGRVVAIAIICALWPFTLLFCVVRVVFAIRKLPLVIFRSITFIGRGIRDVYRAFCPSSNLPKARVVK